MLQHPFSADCGTDLFRPLDKGSSQKASVHWQATWFPAACRHVGGLAATCGWAACTTAAAAQAGSSRRRRRLPLRLSMAPLGDVPMEALDAALAGLAAADPNGHELSLDPGAMALHDSDEVRRHAPPPPRPSHSRVLRGAWVQGRCLGTTLVNVSSTKRGFAG